MHAGEVVDAIKLAIAKADELLEPAKPYMTPSNAALGVASLLAVAGLSHAVPGPMLKLQSKVMGIPEWFILCAGLLMMASGGLYYVQPVEGLYAVALCMGGAGATAAMMPDMLHRPGGVVFSSLTLAAAVWADVATGGEMSPERAAIVALAYAAGVAGRMYVPTSSAFAKRLGFLGGGGAAGEAAKPASTTPPTRPNPAKAVAAPPPSPKAKGKATARGAPPAKAAAARGSAASRVATPPPRR